MPATATPPPTDLLTPAEAAALCGRSEGTLRRWIDAKKLKARRILGRVFVRRADVERLLTGAPVKG